MGDEAPNRSTVSGKQRRWWTPWVAPTVILGVAGFLLTYFHDPIFKALGLTQVVQSITPQQTSQQPTTTPQTENKVTGSGNTTGNTANGDGNVVGNDNKVSPAPKAKPAPPQTTKPKSGEPTSQKSTNTVQGSDNVTGNTITGSDNIVGNGNTVNHNYPVPKVMLDHRGNLEVRGTPQVSRDPSGYDIRVEYSVWNAGDYEVEPMAIIVTCVQLMPELSGADQALLTPLNWIQLTHLGFCLAYSPAVNTIQPKGDYGPIRVRRMCFVGPPLITEKLQDRSWVVYVWVAAYYSDSLSANSPNEQLHTSFCREYTGPNFDPGVCALANDGIHPLAVPMSTERIHLPDSFANVTNAKVTTWH
jgi:hypothetical protein